MIRKILLLSLFTFLIGACGSPTIPISTVTPTSSIQKSILPPTSTSMPQPSRTPTRTTTSTPTDTSTPQPFESFAQCITIGTEVPLQGVAKNGTVVYGSKRDPYKPPYLYNLETGSQYTLPYHKPTEGLTINGWHTSSDANLLGYLEEISRKPQTIQYKLWVVNAKGEQLGQGIFEVRGFNGWHWLDSENVQIQQERAMKDGTALILNPFTQEQTFLSNELPNFYDEWGTRPFEWLVEYSPDFQRVVYLAAIYDPLYLGAILWNPTEKKEIWRSFGSGYHATFNAPQWSPTGDEFAIVIDDKLYLVSREGVVTDIPESGDRFYVSKFHWSPDGKYIAFWSMIDNDQQKHLMFYNTQLDQVTYSCIVDEHGHGSGAEFIWSADSQQFITDITQKQPDGSYKEFDFSILVDIPNNAAYRITGDTKPIEWMNSAR